MEFQGDGAGFCAPSLASAVRPQATPRHEVHEAVEIEWDGSVCPDLQSQPAADVPALELDSGGLCARAVEVDDAQP